jgi:hypothetical protein
MRGEGATKNVMTAAPAHGDESWRRKTNGDAPQAAKREHVG